MELTVTEALQIVSAFFETEWPETEEKDVSIRPISGGFVNTLHLISRSNMARNEPASVLIRHFGQAVDAEEPPPSSTTLSATEQAVMCYEMGRRGWGPKLYGTFPGGRVEEFIVSHTLTAAESMEPKIRRDIARSYARLHSLDLPFRKQNFKQAVSEMTEIMAKKDALAEGLAKLDCGQEAEDLAKIIRTTDWAGELEWVSSLFIKHDCKKAVVIGDANYLNILVKDFDSECQIMLIDYETAAYAYRGIDIGGHFTERQYCWGDPKTNLTGFPPSNLEEQRAFCESYIHEMQIMGRTMTAIDTVEHLLIESNIGRLYQILFSVSLCFRDGVPAELTWAGSMSGLIHMMESYTKLKQQFVKSCPP